MLVHPAAATRPFSTRSVARERASGSQGRGHITSPSPGLQGPHGQAAWPDGAEVEAAPARRVLVASLNLRDGAPGAVVALEAGVGGYHGRGVPSPRAFKHLTRCRGVGSGVCRGCTALYPWCRGLWFGAAGADGGGGHHAIRQHG